MAYWDAIIKTFNQYVGRKSIKGTRKGFNMKKVALVALVLMVGYMAGSMSLTDSFAKAKAIMLCFADDQCTEIETSVPPGFARKFVRMMEDTQEAINGMIYDAVAEYMAENPCTCAADESASAPMGSIASFPAIIPPVFTGELSGMWAPPNHIVEDTKVDMWLETLVGENYYYTPLFK